MVRGTVLCCIAIGLIQLTSGEQCAYDVRLIQNQTGCFLEWSELGKTCGPVWIRTGYGRYYNDTLLTATPMSIVCGSDPRVVCSQPCTYGYDINIINVTAAVSTTQPTTSSRLLTTSLRNVPISNTLTPVPRATRVPKEPEDEFPTLLVVLSVCSVIVLILVVLLVVCLVKKRRTQPDKTSASDVNSTRSFRREDIRHIVSTDESGKAEETYTEMGEVSPPARDVYAVVVKKQDRAGTSAVEDMYAVVQKPPKESGHAADLGSMYAEVQKPSKAAKQPMLQEATNGQNQEVSRHKNKDGLIYLDVDFSQTLDQKESGHPLLDSPSRDCEYAEVHHT